MNLRRFFPPSGLPYELFDAGVFVAGLAALWYVTTPPSMTTNTALADTLSRVFEPHTWGVGMMVVGGIAVRLSYGEWRAVRAGYIVLFIAVTAWSVSLAFGVLVTWPSWDIAGKTLGSALIYAWVSRRLLANVEREVADRDDH